MINTGAITVTPQGYAMQATTKTWQWQRLYMGSQWRDRPVEMHTRPPTRMCPRGRCWFQQHSEELARPNPSPSHKIINTCSVCNYCRAGVTYTYDAQIYVPTNVPVITTANISSHNTTPIAGQSVLTKNQCKNYIKNIEKRLRFASTGLHPGGYGRHNYNNKRCFC